MTVEQITDVFGWTHTVNKNDSDDIEVDWRRSNPEDEAKIRLRLIDGSIAKRSTNRPNLRSVCGVYPVTSTLEMPNEPTHRARDRRRNHHHTRHRCRHRGRDVGHRCCWATTAPVRCVARRRPTTIADLDPPIDGERRRVFDHGRPTTHRHRRRRLARPTTPNAATTTTPRPPDSGGEPDGEQRNVPLGRW